MIENLEEKLSGELPITRKELFILVDSWGRSDGISSDDNIYINKCDAKECYDLSKLDVSKITDLSYLFVFSPYNGDLSNWDISNCESIYGMFYRSQFNNNSISNWNVSNCLNFKYTFSSSLFDGDISNWYIKESLDLTCYCMLDNNKNFRNKYNDGERLPESTKGLKNWLEENREKMREINTPTEEILEFFNFNITLTNQLN